MSENGKSALGRHWPMIWVQSAEYGGDVASGHPVLAGSLAHDLVLVKWNDSKKEIISRKSEGNRGELERLKYAEGWCNGRCLRADKLARKLQYQYNATTNDKL